MKHTAVIHRGTAHFSFDMDVGDYVLTEYEVRDVDDIRITEERKIMNDKMEELEKTIEDANKVIQVALQTGNEQLGITAMKVLEDAQKEKEELESAVSVSEETVDASFSLSLGDSFAPVNRIEDEKEDDTPPHLKR